MDRKRSRPDSDDEEKRSPRATKVTKRSNHETGAILRLSRFLSFEDISTSEHTLSRFAAIADILLREVRLQVTSSPSIATSSLSGGLDPYVTTTYELLEVEFYLWKAESHEDPFTHGSEEQRHSGRWYFHRAPTRASIPSERRAATAAGGYRGGTRKGLDLTFGGSTVHAAVASRYFTSTATGDTSNTFTSAHSADIRGGILLRTMRRTSDRKLISGPSLLVDELLRVSKASSIADLITNKWNDETFAWQVTPSASSSSQPARVTLQLIPASSDPSSNRQELQIFSSPRIGLDLSHSSIPIPATDTDMERTLKHPRLTFIARPYRFFVQPELLIANGRGHTFLGVYHSLTSPTTLNKGSLESMLVNLTGLKLATVEKYLREYRKHAKSRNIKPFVGSRGKGAGSSPLTALQMFGALGV